MKPTTSNEGEMFEQVARRIDPQGRLLRSWKLSGGVSAQMTGLEIALPDSQTKKVIVRQHGEADRQHNPRIAADEFKLLHLLQEAGLPVPTPYHLDESGKIFPTPYVVLEYIEGQPDFAPANLSDFLHQLADILAKVHRIDASKLSFLPKQTKGFGDRPATLDTSLDEGRIRDTLEASWPLPQVNEPVLLHGDFWPGNLLWKDGRLVAVIDWEDARVGDPLADVANSRLEILWAFGMEAMQTFTHHYRAIMPTLDFTHLPYWDLCAALRPAAKLSEWGLDATTEQAMREGHKLFVAQALEELRM